MAEIITKTESKTSITASEIVNIDLDTNTFSREVFQIALADLAPEQVLDFLLRYSEEVIVPPSSSSRLVAWTEAWKMKVKEYTTEDGTLNAKQVVERLQTLGISNETMFLS